MRQILRFTLFGPTKNTLRYNEVRPDGSAYATRLAGDGQTGPVVGSLYVSKAVLADGEQPPELWVGISDIDPNAR